MIEPILFSPATNPPAAKMNIVVFEDAGVDKLYPITTSRPAYAITCGSFRLIDWLLELDANLVGLVRPYLETIQFSDFPQLADRLDSNLKWTLVVNARLVPTVSNVRKLQSMLGQSESDEAIVVRAGWSTAAAIVPTQQLASTDKSNWGKLIEEFSCEPDTEQSENGFELLEYPHDVILQNLSCFGASLAHRIGTGRYEQLQKGVHIGDGVEISDHVVFDSSTGAIVIEDGARIGPMSFLRGPIYIGPASKISEHSSIKDAVSIGRKCKIGGEVEGCVVESYSNKQHHGFLGHSYLGSWINLGAGTCNSDLKNTYGTVNVDYGNEKTGKQKVSTGSQFIGCVMGDYAKTAINTCIFTGKTIGVGSMVYGFATTNVPSFVNYARTFGEMGGLPPEVIIKTQQRMFARRDVKQRPCDMQLIHDMYRLTKNERPDGLSDEPIGL